MSSRLGDIETRRLSPTQGARLWVVLLAFSMLAFGGCVPAGSRVTGQQISANSSTLDFGSVTLGTAKLGYLTLTNRGPNPLVLSHASVAGQGFRFDSPKLPVTLDSGGRVSVIIEFSALKAGNFVGGLSLSDASGGSCCKTILKATGIEAPTPMPSSGTPPATAAPVISSVAVGSVTSSSAAITWKTDLASTSEVEYGEDVAYGKVVLLDVPGTTQHTVTLGSLAGNTTYHFRVRSQDVAGAEAVSGDYSFLTPNAVSAGNTFYVDVVHGNDGNDGRSPASSWKSIAKVNSSTFRPGDQVLFLRGQDWREQLIVPSSGSSGATITFGNYGTGPAARILGSESKNSSIDWSNESVSLWYTSLTQVPKIVWRDSTRLTQVLSKSDLSQDGTWFWDPTSSRAYVFSKVNPATSGSIFEIAQRANCITSIDKSFITIDGLACNFTNDTGINPTQSVGVSTDWTIKNCVLKGFWSQGIRMRGSGVHQFDRFAATGNSIADFGGSTSGVGGANAGIYVTFADGATVASNSIVLSDLPNNGYGSGIQYSHTTSTNSYSSIHDNYITGALTEGAPNSSGVVLENVSSVDIYQNQISTNTAMGIWFDESMRGAGDGPTHCKVHHNLIAQYGHYSDRGIFLENSPDNEIDYNIVNAYATNNYNKGIWVHSATGGSSSNTVIVNNTVIGPNGLPYNALQLGWSEDTAETKSCIVKNNIFYSNIFSSILLVADNPQHSGENSGQAIDSNLYFHPGAGPIWEWYGTVFDTLTFVYQSSGNEANGIQSDPMFVNIAAGDFRLAISSPAGEAGENLGSNYDMGFNSQAIVFPYGLSTQGSGGRSGWSIGAFVF